MTMSQRCSPGSSRSSPGPSKQTKSRFRQPSHPVHPVSPPMPHSYEYPRAALTVDCVVFGFDDGELKVLLIQRALEPFKGRWALPGGFVRVDETVDEAARRELAEEAGLKNVFLEQLYTFGEVGRDPRERVVSVA